MIRANYIFNLFPETASGACLATVAVKGYYVLANNIDLANNSQLFNRAYNADGSNGSGDYTVQIWSDSKDVGFRGTLDGRGFALKNINPYGSSAGMFGAFYGATVKNMAFYSLTNSASNGSGLVLGNSYNSRFENVYIKLIGNNNGDNYSNYNSFKALGVTNNHGGSTFINMVVESMDGLLEGRTNDHQRMHWGNTTGSYTNTAFVGMPASFAREKSTTDESKYVLKLYVSADAIASFAAQAGVEYALEDCDAAVPYANLIANIETRYPDYDIAYITFVAIEGTDYYLDNTALSADTELVATYVETGCWKVVEGALVWASLA